MLIFFLLSSMIFFSLSPMSLSILVVFLSVTMSVSVYFSSMFIIFSVLIIFIFSSGMMVMFCYCAIMANYEESQKFSFFTFFSFFLGFFLIFGFSSSSLMGEGVMSYMLDKLVYFSSNFIIFVMVFISLLLKGINVLLYNPVKSLMESY